MGALGRGGIYLFEGFRLDRNAGVLFRRDEAGAFVPLAIGSRALDVLGVLLERVGDLVSRDEFMAAVWPATAVEDINLNMQIAALRRVLDAGRANGSCIQTIPGRGYRLAVSAMRVESSGQRSGNGAGGPVAQQPEPENAAPPSRSGNTRPWNRSGSANGSVAGVWPWLRALYACFSPCSRRRACTCLSPEDPARPRACRSSCCRLPTSAMRPTSDNWRAASPRI